MQLFYIVRKKSTVKTGINNKIIKYILGLITEDDLRDEIVKSLKRKMTNSFRTIFSDEMNEQESVYRFRIGSLITRMMTLNDKAEMLVSETNFIIDNYDNIKDHFNIDSVLKLLIQNDKLLIKFSGYDKKYSNLYEKINNLYTENIINEEQHRSLTNRVKTLTFDSVDINKLGYNSKIKYIDAYFYPKENNLNKVTFYAEELDSNVSFELTNYFEYDYIYEIMYNYSISNKVCYIEYGLDSNNYLDDKKAFADRIINYATNNLNIIADLNKDVINLIRDEYKYIDVSYGTQATVIKERLEKIISISNSLSEFKVFK